MSDDPLERLAAEQEWRDRAKAVEAEFAKSQRKARVVRQLRKRPRLRPVRSGPPRRRGRISWIFLALIALFLTTGISLWAQAGPVRLNVFVFVLSGWLITLWLHEFSHALTAHRGIGCAADASRSAPRRRAAATRPGSRRPAEARR